MDRDELGKVAYEGYGNAVGWTTASGGAMPLWEDQHPKLRKAWTDAARCVARRVADRVAAEMRTAIEGGALAPGARPPSRPTDAPAPPPPPSGGRLS